MNKQSMVFLLISASILSSSCGKKDAVHTTTHSIQPDAPTSFTGNVTCVDIGPGLLAITVSLTCSTSLINATTGFSNCKYQLGNPLSPSSCSYDLLVSEPIAELCTTSSAGKAHAIAVDCVTCADVTPLPVSLLCS